VPDTALEQALDELYAADPADFVTARKQLVADLRGGGDRAGANQLKTARRPSTSAWALNQMARRQPQLVAALLERSAELLAAQSRPRFGEPDRMQDVIRAHRTALAVATDAALAILGSRANDGFRREIVSTLRAASTDPDTGRDLERGRVVREADASSGFPDATHLTLVPALAAAPPKPKKTPAPPDRSRGLERAAHADREVKRSADLARRAEASATAAAADVAAKRAGENVERLEAELDTARRELRDARARSRKATDEAERLTARLDAPR
jgi:hypothetical protein